MRGEKLRLRLRDVRLTSVFRLTAILGSTFLIGIVVLLGLIYGLTARELTRRSDYILRQEARQWLAVPAAARQARIAADKGRGDEALSYVALFSRRGERLAGDLGDVALPPADRPIEVEAAGDHGPARLLTVATPDGETIVVGRDITPLRDLRQRLLIILLASGMVTVSGMALAATLLSLEPQRRVRDLQRSAREIAAGRLDTRMPIAGRHDELDQFAQTVNLMVEDVARLMDQVKGVTDAIAHDLRTPLTRVRAQLHRARHLSEGADDLAPLLASAEGDLDLALNRFAALLRISEIEAGARRAAFAPTDMARLLAEIVILYEPLAEEGGITLAADVGALPDISADRHLLFEAISNLVDNAIKFSRGAVTITASVRNAAMIVEISDDGPGIAAGERDAALRRFHRGAKAAGYPGTGLGLSIAAAILTLHGFALELDDAAPGLIARVHIPIA